MIFSFGLCLQALHAAVRAVHSDHQAVTDVAGSTGGTHDGLDIAVDCVHGSVQRLQA